MALPVESGPAARGVSPRIANAVIGVWLVISAFVWPHVEPQRANTWICGAICVVVALVAMAVPWMRYLNTLLGIWLFISAWALSSGSPGTIWNNVLCSIAIFVISLIPSPGEPARPGSFPHPIPPRPV